MNKNDRYVTPPLGGWWLRLPGPLYFLADLFYAWCDPNDPTSPSWRKFP